MSLHNHSHGCTHDYAPYMFDHDAQPHSALLHALDHVAHILPAQSPLSFFVHHNTLHMLEEKPFFDAVLEGSRLYGAEPFMAESFYIHALREGRITQADCMVAYQEYEHADHQADTLVCHMPNITRRDYRTWRLTHPLELPPHDALAWWMAEHQPLTTMEHSIFERLMEYADTPCSSSASHEAMEDRVRPVLVRLAGAYLDQGVALIAMPNREQGFFACVMAYYAAFSAPFSEWERDLTRDARRILRKGMSAWDVIAECLNARGIALADYHAVETYLTQRALMLRGWAGMFHQYETHPEKIPIHPIPATLHDYLAVQLWLEYHAMFGATEPSIMQSNHHALMCYEATKAAVGLGMTSLHLHDAASCNAWLDEVRTFNEVQRRYCYHLAFERHYRQAMLDALLAHQKHGGDAPTEVALQVVCCMDEREESFRRHMEEVNPQIVTYGVAGFFGVAMHYQGIDDVDSRPLCPVVVTPKHHVHEVAIHPEEAHAYRKARAKRGRIVNLVRISRKTLMLGTAWSLVGWLVKPLPLLGRAIAPHLTHRIVHHCAHVGLAHPVTRLDLHEYSVIERADIVCNILKSMGMTRSFSPIVLILGHGSSSLNNPHLAAYNCGATGGGCGNANARAFAAMANDSAVRHILQERGIILSDATWFVGGYHNTTNDQMEYYDTDMIPKHLTHAFQHAYGWMNEACHRDAHERTRRFTHTHHAEGLRTAKYHAEQHATDFAEARPEYGHSTNAMCVIGRREKTRHLFLDRRCFLISYDPTHDADGAIVANILRTAGPVGAGINLEYFFSATDPAIYGCGTKLPHNITGLIGVMDGSLSDLRTGLTLQMVEIHEAMRLLLIVEATPERLSAIAHAHPVVGTLVGNGWIQLIAWHPETGQMYRYHAGQFIPHHQEQHEFPSVASSDHHYRKRAHHLPPVHISH
ncbi:MAG: DUF2309 domain-containing protein [Alphaproteobacteria bacterium]|nr:MAG: DUF2309 domain-containing protein [Alphaproteobacteria bacterium]